MKKFPNLRWIQALSVILVVLLLTRSFLEYHAKEQYRVAQRAVEVKQAAKNEADYAIVQAAQKHLRAYMTSISLDEAQAAIDRGKAILETVKKSKDTDQLLRAASGAHRELKRATQVMQECAKQIATLNLALDQYGPENDQAARSIERARQTIDSRLAAMYLPRHFVSAENLLATARSWYEKARTLRTHPYENGRPDYLQCYRTSLKVKPLTDEAERQTNAVPMLRMSNDDQLNQLRYDLANQLGRYDEASAAAAWLQRYPDHQRRNAVAAGYDNLISARSQLTDAAWLNNMEQQRFSEAAAAMRAAVDRIESAKERFDDTLQTKHRVVEAINSIDSAKSSAASAISKATREINDNSQNSQSDAEAKRDRAKRRLGEADRASDSDPVAKLRLYLEANSLADQAYNEVDTSTRPVASSSDDDDDDNNSSPTYGGGGFGGFGGGSSLSPSPSPGFSGTSGGGTMSGPSGGSSMSGASGGGSGF